MFTSNQPHITRPLITDKSFPPSLFSLPPPLTLPCQSAHTFVVLNHHQRHYNTDSTLSRPRTSKRIYEVALVTAGRRRHKSDTHRAAPATAGIAIRATFDTHIIAIRATRAATNIAIRAIHSDINKIAPPPTPAQGTMARTARVLRPRDSKGRVRKIVPYVKHHTPTNTSIISTNSISSFRFMDLESEIRYVASQSLSTPFQTANSLPETPFTSTLCATPAPLPRSAQEECTRRAAARSATATSCRR
jgi:hypothetical protein